MIAVDTNLLIYAHRADSDFHHQALHALRGLAEGGQPWAIPWPCVHEFLSIATHPRIYDPPSPLPLALKSAEAWTRSPTCRTLGEEPGYLDALKQLALAGKTAGPMIHDARIAALCLQHGVTELWTADRDFSRFGSLKTSNPLTNQ